MNRDNPAVWTLTAADGELLVHTDVGGRAAKMGHRLTIAMRRWRATVRWAAGEPIVAELAVEVNSLEVLRGEGGVTPLSGPEKALVRSNALRSLGAAEFPEISFDTDTIETSSGGYRLTGTLHIHGKVREQVIDLRTDDLGESWRMSCQAVVTQTDFGIKPYSLLMGAVKVKDEVTVSFTAQRAKDRAEDN
ncbi:YceI family protein [Mycobacterium shimoidei]|uniref:YceI family protein n=1 Tax=Mycobacterium shimoidei TaxID=29313 RepID=UPI001FD63261|nr:YceI family protein [Mycobacterium shimoidei]